MDVPASLRLSFVVPAADQPSATGVAPPNGAVTGGTSVETSGENLATSGESASVGPGPP